MKPAKHKPQIEAELQAIEVDSGRRWKKGARQILKNATQIRRVKVAQSQCGPNVRFAVAADGIWLISTADYPLYRMNGPEADRLGKDVIKARNQTSRAGARHDADLLLQVAVGCAKALGNLKL